MSQAPIPYEDPFEPLAFDPTKALPDHILGRLYTVTNSMVRELQCQSANREELMGADKKSLQYKAANIERYKIDARIEALKKKYDTLSHTLYLKSAEMRMASK